VTIGKQPFDPLGNHISYGVHQQLSKKIPRPDHQSRGRKNTVWPEITELVACVLLPALESESRGSSSLEIVNAKTVAEAEPVELDLEAWRKVTPVELHPVSPASKQSSV
jgi:hypothetical protein